MCNTVIKISIHRDTYKYVGRVTIHDLINKAWRFQKERQELSIGICIYNVNIFNFKSVNSDIGFDAEVE